VNVTVNAVGATYPLCFVHFVQFASRALGGISGQRINEIVEQWQRDILNVDPAIFNAIKSITPEVASLVIGVPDILTQGNRVKADQGVREKILSSINLDKIYTPAVYWAELVKE
jgi:hypothetical protein